MVKSRKQSKRLPARKKYKIEKKVREHNRKERKDAKKNAHSKSIPPTHSQVMGEWSVLPYFPACTELKKDPGIPNLFPFKEQLLQQMQARKERVEGEKERQRVQRQLEHTKRRRSLQGLKNDAQRRVGEFEKKVCWACCVTRDENKIFLRCYNAHIFTRHGLNVHSNSVLVGQNFPDD